MTINLAQMQELARQEQEAALAKSGPNGTPPRDIVTVTAELDAARVVLGVMHKENEEFDQSRTLAVNVRRQLELAHMVNPMTRSHKFVGPAVPDRGNAATEAFHGQHYVIERLEKELVAARRVRSGA